MTRIWCYALPPELFPLPREAHPVTRDGILFGLGERLLELLLQSAGLLKSGIISSELRVPRWPSLVVSNATADRCRPKLRWQRLSVTLLILSCRLVECRASGAPEPGLRVHGPLELAAAQRLLTVQPLLRPPRRQKTAAAPTPPIVVFPAERLTLSELRFNPVAGRHDFTTVAEPDRFHYQSEPARGNARRLFRGAQTGAGSAAPRRPAHPAVSGSVRRASGFRALAWSHLDDRLRQDPQA